MRVVSAHMVPKSGHVVNDGSTLPGLWEYNTASQRSFFQLLEKEVKLKSRKFFSRLPALLLREAGMQVVGGA